MGAVQEDAIIAAIWNVFRVLAFAVLIAETGRALVARFDPGSRGLERRVLGLVAGFVALAGIPFVCALTCLVYVKWWLMVAVAALVLLRYRREWIAERRDRDRRRLSRFERGLVAVAATIFVLYALRYEASHFYYGCLHSSVAWTIGEPIGHLATTPIEKILFFHQDAQIGGTAIVAPFAAMIGPLGERVLLGFAPAAIFLLTALALRRFFGERAAAIAALILVLNPWLLRLPQISVNTLAWMAGAALVFLIAHRRVGWLAGFVCGLYVGVLYINVLALPMLAWWAYRSGDRVRFRRFAFGLAFVGLLLLVQNTIAHGHPFSYGSFRTVAETGHQSFAYSLLGVDFHANALFNWPLHDRVVRTPMNAMPVFFLLPMLGLRYFGLLVAGVFVLGVRRLREIDRDAFAAAIVWSVTIGLVLLVQENWLQVEKAHTPFDAFPASALFLGAGVERVLGERRRSWVASYLAALAVLAAFAVAAPRWSVPADARFWELFPRFPRAEDPWLSVEKSLFARPRILPDFSEIPAAFRPGVLRRLGWDLTRARSIDRTESPRETMLRAMIPGIDYGFMMPRGALERDFVNRDRWNAPDDAPVWALELSRAPLEEPPPVTRVAKGEEPVIDGTALPARWTAPPLAWSDRPIDVVSFAHENELYFVLTRPIDERIEGFERTFGGLYDRESKTTGRRPWDSESLAIPTRPWQTNSPRLAFRAMPGRTVHVIDAIYLDPSRIYWRRIELREDGATDRGWNYWHAN